MSEPLMAMPRGAIVNDHASAQLRDFLQSRLVHGASGGDDADTAFRAGLASAMLVGIVTSRRVIGVPVLAAADIDRLVEAVAPAIQQVLTGVSRPVGPDGPGDRPQPA